jgi:hypothetical protein
VTLNKPTKLHPKGKTPKSGHRKPEHPETGMNKTPLKRKTRLGHLGFRKWADLINWSPRIMLVYKHQEKTSESMNSPFDILVGGIPTPSGKYESQLGLLFPIHIWKNKSHVPAILVGGFNYF